MTTSAPRKRGPAPPAIGCTLLPTYRAHLQHAACSAVRAACPFRALPVPTARHTPTAACRTAACRVRGSRRLCSSISAEPIANPMLLAQPIAPRGGPAAPPAPGGGARPVCARSGGGGWGVGAWALRGALRGAGTCGGRPRSATRSASVAAGTRMRLARTAPHHSHARMRTSARMGTHQHTHTPNTQKHTRSRAQRRGPRIVHCVGPTPAPALGPPPGWAGPASRRGRRMGAGLAHAGAGCGCVPRAGERVSRIWRGPGRGAPVACRDARASHARGPRR